jgi:hypothetical protein
MKRPALKKLLGAQTNSLNAIAKRAVLNLAFIF